MLPPRCMPSCDGREGCGTGGMGAEATAVNTLPGAVTYMQGEAFVGAAHSCGVSSGLQFEPKPFPQISNLVQLRVPYIHAS